MEDYHITTDNIYNIDKKGFVIGLGSVVKRIMAIKVYKSGRVKQAVQDGNREFITLIAYVNALGKAGIPTLLYQSKTGDLQDTWIEDLEANDKAYFGSSANGWSNKAFGLKWLQEVFKPNTRPQSSRTWRLLIFDGHSSHVNLQFINWAFNHKILLLVLPPHSTHKLQPLDASLFGLLAIEYQVQLNTWLQKLLGILRFTKHNFWKLFWAAWKKSFAENQEAVQGAFQCTGI